MKLSGTTKLSWNSKKGNFSLHPIDLSTPRIDVRTSNPAHFLRKLLPTGISAWSPVAQPNTNLLEML